MTPSTDSVAAAKSQNGKTAGPRQRPALVRLDLDGMAKIKRKISRLRKPEDMSLEAWQIALRRQFGREQKFRLKNIGKDPIFSEFEVANPQTRRRYRVAIRGDRLGGEP